jgi:hypothetical protein
MRNESTGDLVLSHDGIDLQRIVVRHRPHDKAFDKLKRAITSEMLPSELAELAIAEIKTSQDEALPTLLVFSNIPFEIAGHTGFAIHLGFKPKRGLRMEVLGRGFTDEHGFYELLYRAPTLYYFEKDRQAFESMVKSMRPGP